MGKGLVGMDARPTGLIRCQGHPPTYVKLATEMNSLRTVPHGRSAVRRKGVLCASCRSLHARHDQVSAQAHSLGGNTTGLVLLLGMACIRISCSSNLIECINPIQLQLPQGHAASCFRLLPRYHRPAHIQSRVRNTQALLVSLGSSASLQHVALTSSP
jgi:hypothetical protein